MALFGRLFPIGNGQRGILGHAAPFIMGGTAIELGIGLAFFGGLADQFRAHCEITDDTLAIQIHQAKPVHGKGAFTRGSRLVELRGLGDVGLCAKAQFEHAAQVEGAVGLAVFETGLKLLRGRFGIALFERSDSGGNIRTGGTKTKRCAEHAQRHDAKADHH